MKEMGSERYLLAILCLSGQLSFFIIHTMYCLTARMSDIGRDRDWAGQYPSSRRPAHDPEERVSLTTFARVFILGRPNVSQQHLRNHSNQRQHSLAPRLGG